MPIIGKSFKEILLVLLKRYLYLVMAFSLTATFISDKSVIQMKRENMKVTIRYIEPVLVSILSAFNYQNLVLKITPYIFYSGSNQNARC